MNMYITQKQRKVGSHHVVIASRINTLPYPADSMCVCITPQLQMMVRQMAVIPAVRSQSRGAYVSVGIAASYDRIRRGTHTVKYK